MDGAGGQGGEVIAEIYAWIFIGIRRKSVLDMEIWKFENSESNPESKTFHPLVPDVRRMKTAIPSYPKYA